MTVTAVDIEILGATFFATHFASADDALAGAERGFTAPKFPLLVGRARRFTSLVTQLHIEVCGALPAPATAASQPMVFATCHGEIQTAHHLIGEFRDTGEVSSAHFAQSVHNTPSGLYSVATGNQAHSTTVTGTNAVAAGWLEATLIAREANGPVLLSIADEPVPAAFGGPSEPGGVAAAFLLSRPQPRRPGAGTPARLAIEESGDETEGTLSILARTVKLIAARAPGTVALGSISPGGMLSLRLAPDAERATP